MLETSCRSVPGAGPANDKALNRVIFCCRGFERWLSATAFDCDAGVMVAPFDWLLYAWHTAVCRLLRLRPHHKLGARACEASIPTDPTAH